MACADRFGDVDGLARKLGNTPGLYVYFVLNPNGHRDGADHAVSKTMKFMPQLNGQGPPLQAKADHRRRGLRWPTHNELRPRIGFPRSSGDYQDRLPHVGY